MLPLCSGAFNVKDPSRGSASAFPQCKMHNLQNAQFHVFGDPPADHRRTVRGHCFLQSRSVKERKKPSPPPWFNVGAFFPPCRAKIQGGGRGFPRSQHTGGVRGLTQIFENFKKSRNLPEDWDAKLIGIGVSIATNASSVRPIGLAARVARASVKTVTDSDVL